MVFDRMFFFLGGEAKNRFGTSPDPPWLRAWFSNDCPLERKDLINVKRVYIDYNSTATNLSSSVSEILHWRNQWRRQVREEEVFLIWFYL